MCLELVEAGVSKRNQRRSGIVMHLLAFEMIRAMRSSNSSSLLLRLEKAFTSRRGFVERDPY